MAKTPCKGTKKDGTPCRGNGLEQLDGYCIAHGAPEKTREWRVRGGQNSSSAARADKRLPERYGDVIQALTQGIFEVKEGNMSPAAYAAICRGAGTLIDVHAAADAEMEEIRAEEKSAEAAAVYGLHGDLELLQAADKLADQHEQYRVESLVEQGLASTQDPLEESTSGTFAGKNQAFLNYDGRNLFGLHPLIGECAIMRIEISEEISYGYVELDEMPHALERLHSVASRLNGVRRKLQYPPDLPPDPFTGQPFERLPSGVSHGSSPAFVSDSHDIKYVANQLDEVTQLMLKIKEEYGVGYCPLKRDAP